MTKFIISTDTCADMPRSWYEKNKIHYIPIKYILDGEEHAKCFDKEAEFDAFYDGIKNGALPTTAALNPFELKEYFENILKAEKTGDIIHVCLSSGLSVTHQNAVSAAAEINKDLKGRKVYVIDSLSATVVIGAQLEELVKLREQGVAAQAAVEAIETYRDNQQGWVIMSDLFHLKRGGRISPTKAAIGTMLNIRPVIHLSKIGKLGIENKERGNLKAIKYVISRMEKYAGPDFPKSTIWVARTSQSELYEQFLVAVRKAYPEMVIKTAVVGPVIGAHLGCGGVGVVWHGNPRLDIE